MLKIYYTNSSTYGGEQTDPNKSLGGFLARTPVANGIIGNLFSDISQYSLKKKDIETKLIAIINEYTTTINNLHIWVENQNSEVFDYELALVYPNSNTKGELIFEQISNKNAIPIYAKFYKTSQEEPFVKATLSVNECIGLWIKRSFKKGLDISEIVVNESNVDLKVSWE